MHGLSAMECKPIVCRAQGSLLICVWLHVMAALACTLECLFDWRACLHVCYAGCGILSAVCLSLPRSIYAFKPDNIRTPAVCVVRLFIIALQLDRELRSNRVFEAKNTSNDVDRELSNKLGNKTTPNDNIASTHVACACWFKTHNLIKVKSDRTTDQSVHAGARTNPHTHTKLDTHSRVRSALI